MIRRILVSVLTQLVRGYQLVVSPWFAPTCRYYPSCSEYAINALKEHGPLRGLQLATWRLLRCNPWSNGGVDHVPPRRSRSSKGAEDYRHHDDTSPSVERPGNLLYDGPGGTTHPRSGSSDKLVVDESVRAPARPAWRTVHGNL